MDDFELDSTDASAQRNDLAMYLVVMLTSMAIVATMLLTDTSPVDILDAVGRSLWPIVRAAWQYVTTR
jgi:energy-coupling factor transporter transmembrane protein EcfT